ncbi:MAG: hypothetical protein KDM63_01670 [Verrucomicrobiae bacterium]|nr:hypothetical protein [Verrucomicrobiae bacterium]MCB1085727.1 hypothetical protein [Verrucomicrobiae bacterium]MCB1091939.1 hypothetical protein [Verrucomicrobiae bacterium]
MPSLRCLLRLTLDAGDGSEAEVELDIEEWLRGPFDHDAKRHLPSRVTDVLERQLLPAFRRALWQWLDKQSAAPASFEEEFARRCDRNHEVMDALEWIAPHLESDEEREWKSRMVDIFMAQCENERVR